MQGEGFAGAAFVFIEGMEATEIRVIEPRPEVVLAEVGVPPFTAIEIESMKVEG